jgi:uncharacterized protein (TIGR02588 family)
VASERAGGRGQHPSHAKPSTWEWVVAGLGAAIVLSAVAFMLYDAITAGPHPTPRITVRADTVIEYGSGYVVEFRAVNEGDATAAAVIVSGELGRGTGVLERTEVTLDYIPARSSRTGGLVFANDPRTHRLALRAKGFNRP